MDVEEPLASADSFQDSSFNCNVENWPGFISYMETAGTIENIAFFKEKLYDLIPQLVNQVDGSVLFWAHG